MLFMTPKKLLTCIFPIYSHVFTYENKRAHIFEKYHKRKYYISLRLFSKDFSISCRMRYAIFILIYIFEGFVDCV